MQYQGNALVKLNLLQLRTHAYNLLYTLVSNLQKQSFLPCKYYWCSFYVETS